MVEGIQLDNSDDEEDELLMERRWVKISIIYPLLRKQFYDKLVATHVIIMHMTDRFMGNKSIEKHQI